MQMLSIPKASSVEIGKYFLTFILQNKLRIQLRDEYTAKLIFMFKALNAFGDINIQCDALFRKVIRLPDRVLPIV